MRPRRACATLESGSVLMKPLLLAAVLAAAFPGSALGAGLTTRDLSPQAPRGAVPTGVFQLVGVHWRGPGLVKYRTRNLAGRWSAWRVFSAEDALPDRGREQRATRGWRIGEPVLDGRLERDPVPDRRPRRAAAGVLRARAEAGRLRRSGRDLAGAPPIITRAGWHADESIRRAAPYYADSVHFAIVHHTAGSNSYTKAQSASIVRAIELYHVQGNGWNDIGYNFLVDKYGQIFEGRYGGMTRPVIGAHAEGFNTGSVGIALIGDYSSTSITPAARAALVSLIAWRLDLDARRPGFERRADLVRQPALRGGQGGHAASRSPGTATSTRRAVPARASTRNCPRIRRGGRPDGPAEAVRAGDDGNPRRPGAFHRAALGRGCVDGDRADATKLVVASGSGTGTTVDWTWNSAGAAARPATPGRSARRSCARRPAPSGPRSAPLSLQQLKVAPAIVTPNGDGRSDEAKLTYRVSVPALVTATCSTRSATVVATLFSQRRPAGASEFAWSDVALPDGRYRARARSPRTLAASRCSPPSSSTSTARSRPSRRCAGVLAERRRPARLARLRFQLNAPAHVRLRVLRGTSVAATPLDADLPPGRSNLTWDGGGLPDGRYTAVVSAPTR